MAEKKGKKSEKEEKMPEEESGSVVGGKAKKDNGKKKVPVAKVPATPEESVSPEEVSPDEKKAASPAKKKGAAKKTGKPTTVISKAKQFGFDRSDLPFNQVQLLTTFRNSRRRPGDLSGLMASVMEKGLQTPLTVWGQPCDEMEIDGEMVKEQYFLIAGFRRYDAVQHLNSQHPGIFPEVPVHIFRGSHEEAADINLTENIQREDLTPYEVGLHMVYMMEEFGLSPAELVDRFGKSQTFVSFVVKMARADGVHDDLVALVEGNRVNIWTAQTWAYKSLDEQEAFVKRYLAALEEGKQDPKKASDGKEKKEKVPSRRRKIRSIAEIQETLDGFAKTDKAKLNETQKAHISGIMKGLYWGLNNPVEWKPINPDKWGFEYEPMEEE